MTYKKILLVLFGLICLIGGFVVLQSGRHEVAVITPVFAPAVQAVYATGTVEAARMIPIAPKTTARIAALMVDEGAIVTQGQELAQLEDSDVRNTLMELEAKLEKAHNDLTRAQTLSKGGAISKEALDQAQTNFRAAQASVDRTKAELGFLQLHAPEDGTIIRRDGEVGEMASVSAPVFWMTGGNDYRIETDVDEEDIALVKPGQRVLIRADAFPGQIFEGAVLSITPKGDPVARSYRVRVSMPEESPLMIGMTAETNIITQEKDSALMIPLSALGNNGHVIIIQDNKAVIRSVKTGIKTLKDVEIIDGITQTDMVIQKYDATLLDKSHVRTHRVTWNTPESK